MYFKMHFFMFMTLCLFGHARAECPIDTFTQETTSSSAKVCLETYTPECGNLTSLFINEQDIETFEQDGCTVLKCPAGERPWFMSSFENSEFPKPTAEKPSNNNAIDINAPRSTEHVEQTFSQFGIECDGDKWKATKYPLGIHYLTTDYETINLGIDGLYDGMKSEVINMAW
ncbi:DUF19 domain-containing protein [Caenorhabditis elegans]|uniref:DUF19 domain-containing protein n=1 Tax=Caenorhabditis elegans TaxID=6239 RepID=Q9U5B3_CAEEL|nr:DUF19 domain-containing protein [Caenorhabditis elegans]CCD69615.1 DUF19 domain-containing protein [Caenorhabditis elegans]|eukprot:NP_001254052.1 Uncharacterized protein CELE_F43C11.1 [Caenorhabditis elegans]